MTSSDAAALRQWMKEGCRELVQNVVPNWTKDERELLITGMDDEEFKAYLGPEEDE